MAAPGDNGPTDLRELARQLGTYVLDSEEQLLLAHPSSHARARLMTDALDSLDPRFWTELASGDRSPDWLMGLGVVRRALGVAEGRVIVVRALLATLCLHGLSRWFSRCHDVVDLRRGDAIPLPRRPVNLLFDPSPSPASMDEAEPLTGTNFRLWRQDDGEVPHISLDYTHRELIDDVLWPVVGQTNRLPILGTIHLSERVEVDDLDDDTFYGVHPPDFDEDAVLEALRTAKVLGVDVVVFPELSLPTPDALQDVIRGQHAVIPRMVVAGSAHATDRSANVSITYVDGVAVLEHAKRRPFRWRGENGERVERLAPVSRFTLASGDSSRLGVLICSDLLHTGHGVLLKRAAVNAFFCPLLTGKPGTFIAEAGHFAATEQAIVVMPNAPLDGGLPNPLAIFAAPHEGRQVETLAAVSTPVDICWCDPNDVPLTPRRASDRTG